MKPKPSVASSLRKSTHSPAAVKPWKPSTGRFGIRRQLSQDFTVEGFAAPYVVVRRKSDGQRGTLMFQHSPRFYFGFEPHHE